VRYRRKKFTFAISSLDEFLYIHGLGLATTNLNTKFEVPISPLHKDIKGNAKCTKWGGWGT